MGPVGEQKTKPTQHTVKELRGLGITLGYSRLSFFISLE